MSDRDRKSEEIDIKIKYGNEVHEFNDVPVDISTEKLLSQIVMEICTPELKLPGGKMIKFYRPKYTLQIWKGKHGASLEELRGVLQLKQIGGDGNKENNGILEEKDRMIEMLERDKKKAEEKLKELNGISDYLLKSACDYFWGLNGVHVDYHKPHEIYEQIVNAGGENDGKSLYILGRSYEFGFGVKKDETFCFGYGVKEEETKSLEYFKKAAEFYKSKNEDDLPPIDWAIMGWMYIWGDGFKDDQSKGIRLLKRGVDEGNVIAMDFLGICYEKGYGVDVDYSKSLKLFRKAADAGLPGAIKNLGDMYYDGSGVEEDKKEAFRLYLKAAERGLRLAMHNVGALFQSGQGVKENLKEAKRWFKKAAALGDEDAKEELEQYKEGLTFIII